MSLPPDYNDTGHDHLNTFRKVLRAAFAVLLAGGLQQAVAADRFEDIRAFIRAEMADKSVPSISVAVAQAGKIDLEKPNGDVHVKVGDQLTTLINQASFKDGKFSGEFVSRIGTPDTERTPYTIELSMRLRGTVLNGDAEASGSPGPRVRNALSHWLELKKE